MTGSENNNEGAEDELHFSGLHHAGSWRSRGGVKSYMKFNGKILKETVEEHDLVFIFRRSLCSKCIKHQFCHYPDDKTLGRENENSSADIR